MPDQMFRVQMYDGFDWIGCVREDLLIEGSCVLPAAVFQTKQDAEAFMEWLRGLNSGSDVVFRIV